MGTTTTKGSITSVQAIYVPADDLTDPAPATTFAHLDAMTVLSRQIAELGIYPNVLEPLERSALTRSHPAHTQCTLGEGRRQQHRARRHQIRRGTGGSFGARTCPADFYRRPSPRRLRDYHG